LWQFIPSTGYKYNLNRDDWIDERMDPDKSTLAAIAYLRELHGMFGDWLTVLAAYNCGEGRVMRVISRQHINYLDRFWDLYSQLPNETARYVPRFLATLHIIRDPRKYGMDLDGGLSKPQPLAYDVVKTNKSMRLQDIAQKLELPEEQLNALNAELRFKITPGKPYSLRVPPEMGGKFAALVDDIPAWERPLPVVAQKTRAITITHRVRKGESLGSISTKYGVSAKTIRTCNPGASLKGGVKTGQRLFIPVNTRRYASSTSPGKASGSTITYKVKRGDTLSSIAARHSMSMAEVREMNAMKSSSVRIGQVLRLSSEAGGDGGKKSTTPRKTAVPAKKAGRKEASGSLKAETKKSKTYVVKKGDNLYRIAANRSMDVERLKELNRLTGAKAASLREGQVLVVE
jgi:membrane-bound lytic murein transglycosylase D